MKTYNFSLRVRIIALVSIIFLIFMGIAAFLVTKGTTSSLMKLSLNSAEDTARVVADSMQAFGEAGEMEGLNRFIDNVKKHNAAIEVRAVRAPSVIAEHGNRAGAPSPDKEEADVITTAQSKTLIDSAAHTIRYVAPLVAEKRCLKCHEVKEGSVLGTSSLLLHTDETEEAKKALLTELLSTFVLCLLMTALIAGVLISVKIVRPIHSLTMTLDKRAGEVRTSANQITSTAEELASSASTQASSLEETAAALEQTSSMTMNNAQSAIEARQLANRATVTAKKGDEIVERLNKAMRDIHSSSMKIENIIQLIGEIAFQTNLLALNAAVEAARAGEHGKGFAVVAEEVRTLAQRSRKAADETTKLIKDSVNKAHDGEIVAEEVSAALIDITAQIAQTASLVDQISVASEEQSRGIGQINTSVADLDKTTQRTAASSEQSAAAAGELRNQANALQELSKDLTALIVGDPLFRKSSR